MSSSLRPRCLTDVPIEFRKVYLNAHSNPWPYRLFLVPKLPAEDGVPKQPKKRPPIAFFSSRQGSRLEYTNGLWQPPTTKMSEGKIYKWIDQRWQRWPRNMPSEEGDQSGTYIPAGSLASSRDLEVRCEKVILQFQMRLPRGSAWRTNSLRRRRIFPMSFKNRLWKEDQVR